MDKKLTPKQERFVDEYLIDLNATQAAIRAGYSEKEFYSKTNGKGYYVYFLIDPRNNQIFYVGKGKGRRIKQHSTEARGMNIVNAIKVDRIRDVWKSGAKVVEVVFVDELEESSAFTIERKLIERFSKYGLANIQSGVVVSNLKLRRKIKNCLERMITREEFIFQLEQQPEKLNRMKRILEVNDAGGVWDYIHNGFLRLLEDCDE